MKKIIYAVLALTLTASVSQAQKLKFTEGDEKLAFLKGEKSLNIEYTYNDMMVGKKAEADYLKEKKDGYNAKQPGKGDRFAEKWVNNRSSVFEPMFEELISKILFKEKSGVTAARGQKDAKYTVQVHTTMTEPGFNSVVLKVNPSCNYEIAFIESATKKVLAKADLKGVIGINMGGSDLDFDAANSIKECYAKAGKVVGKAVSKAAMGK